MENELLTFLLENSVRLVSEISGRKMIADEAYVLGGEFVVYEGGDEPDIYRGTDLELAMIYMNGDE